jgi:FkbM family methyltransferase
MPLNVCNASRNPCQPWNDGMRKTKALIWKAFMSLGLEIHIRKEPLRFLNRLGVRTVLDIGANEGQFARTARKILPDAKIYSFEPLPAPFSRLCTAFGKDAHFEAFPIALGSEPGEADFEVNDFSPSSSFLPVTEALRRSYPYAARTSKTRVTVSTLDMWAEQYDLERGILVKLDVQGYEDHVIMGGPRTFARASVVIAETSFTALYQGQPLYDDIYQLMRARGFRSAGMIVNGRDADTGEILDSDSIFIRDPLTSI